MSKYPLQSRNYYPNNISKLYEFHRITLYLQALKLFQYFLFQIKYPISKLSNLGTWTSYTITGPSIWVSFWLPNHAQSLQQPFEALFHFLLQPQLAMLDSCPEVSILSLLQVQNPLLQDSCLPQVNLHRSTMSAIRHYKMLDQCQTRAKI